MKTVAFIFVLLTAFTVGQVSGVKYAHCGLGRSADGHESGPSGHVCFKEENNHLSAQIFVTGVKANRASNVHIHKKKPNENCGGVGKKVNIPGPGVEGNLGEITSNSHCNIFVENRQIDGLSLTDPHSIMGKTVVVHLPGTSGKICCTISEMNVVKYTSMTHHASGRAETDSCPSPSGP